MGGGNKLPTALAGVAALAAAGSLVVVLLVYGAVTPHGRKEAAVDAKKLAGELADNNLPDAAIEEYKKILDDGSLTDAERGAVCYLIAKTCFENIGDYETAAAYYIRARALDPDASYAEEAAKSLIACLERLGRRLDAKRELDHYTSLSPDTGRSPGKIIARIGDRQITDADLMIELQLLPAEMQSRFASRDEKLKFLHSMIGRDLIYHAALREGFDRENDVQRDLRRLEKEYLIQYYTRQKIAPNVKLDTAGVRLYYQANKEKYGDKSFEEAREQVVQDYFNFSGQKEIGEYMNALMQAENVRIFEENVN
jgi:tetratricopeptide (TPR) repeat protein